MGKKGHLLSIYMIRGVKGLISRVFSYTKVLIWEVYLVKWNKS